ncbi:MAG: hypothetical protein A2Y81_07875 [Nitrospirae bacterium RBG_13_43_8]|nr:MAG: hypothetical protein A2Y81_07875 [Nitrospirae bacterium RBG_13_43_8]
MKYKGWIKKSLFCSVVILIMGVFVTPVFSSEMADARKERLIERVNSYWDDRIQGRLDKNYEYYDPFFRGVVMPIVYEASLVQIKFHSHQTGNIEITENIAKVPMEVEFEIPETVVLGKAITVPKKKDKWVEDWIWIDGDWFKVFKTKLNVSYISFFPSFPP